MTDREDSSGYSDWTTDLLFFAGSICGCCLLVLLLLGALL